MKLQYQIHDYGCFQACLASILEKTISQVPDFYRSGEEKFGKLMRGWNVHNHNYFLWDIPYSAGVSSKILKKIPIIVTGTSPRDNTMLHSVIYKNWKLIHDPYQDDMAGIIDPAIITLVFNK